MTDEEPADEFPLDEETSIWLYLRVMEIITEQNYFGQFSGEQLVDMFEDDE